MSRTSRPIEPPRSRKALTPREPPAAPRRVRRRQKTGHAAFRKDGALCQAARGPRILWGRAKPKVKKAG